MTVTKHRHRRLLPELLNVSFQETQTDEEEEEEEDEEGEREEEEDRKAEKTRVPAQLCARLKATAQRFLHNMGRVLAVTLLGLAGEKLHTYTLMEKAHLWNAYAENAYSVY